MNMRKLIILAAIAVASILSVSAFAKDAKPMMKMMKGGDMGTMTVKDEKMMGAMMKMAKPMDHCTMIMTGADGKAMMVDTSTPDAMKECEKMAM
jgi:hypothetical protein